jgi:hypothetical protein
LLKEVRIWLLSCFPEKCHYDLADDLAAETPCFEEKIQLCYQYVLDTNSMLSNTPHELRYGGNSSPGTGSD